MAGRGDPTESGTEKTPPAARALWSLRAQSALATTRHAVRAKSPKLPPARAGKGEKVRQERTSVMATWRLAKPRPEQAHIGGRVTLARPGRRLRPSAGPWPNVTQGCPSESPGRVQEAAGNSRPSQMAATSQRLVAVVGDRIRLMTHSPLN